MKRLTTLIALLALAFGLGAATVTAAIPTTPTEFLPVYTFSKVSYTQQIYTQPRIDHQGEITKLRFSHIQSENGTFYNGQTLKIFMGHTTREVFTYRLTWIPIANMTEVFSGPVPITRHPEGEEWVEFTLDTPFVYNNVENLVIAVLSNNHKRYDKVNWGCLHTGAISSLCYLEFYQDEIDINQPPYPEYMMEYIPALQLVFQDTEVPVAPELISPANDATLVNGLPLDWIMPHEDMSNPPRLQPDASGYDVYIDGELVSENQPGKRYIINDLEPGQHTWHVVARNNVGCSPPSETRTFEVEPGMVIGDGSEWYGLPIYPYHARSYSQSIFLQSEMDIGNHRIDKISYYWNGRREAINSNNLLIYMAHTDKTEFANGEDWVPVSEMMQVFDGHVNIPAAMGWVEIELDYPFIYNNTDNLVIAVRENYGRNDWDFFYCTATPSQNRSLLNNEYMDHHSPPAGVLIAGIPNILMRLSEIPADPVVRMLPTTLDFKVAVHGEPKTLNVTVTNMGGGLLDLSAANISFLGPNADEFSIDPVNLPITLGPVEKVQIPVIVTGATPGPISATMRITYDGGICDIDLLAEVTPANVILIGDGDMPRSDPFFSGGGFTRCATLYTADQLNGVGTIDMIAWHCAEIGDAPIRYKIYLKNTTEPILPDQHHVLEQAARVKYGQFVPNTLGWQMFHLDNPFYYTGGNLIVAVVITWTGTTDRYHAKYSHHDNGVENHLAWKYTYQSTGFSHFGAWAPNIMLHFVEGGARNDICALSIDGPLVPTVGEVANYTVRVRNSGSNPQTNYQVKLIGPDDTELAVVNGQPVDSGTIAEVVIPWIPADVGQIDIYAKVILPGDQSDPNDQTKPLRIDILPTGTQAVTIGTGNRVDHIPMDFRFRNTVCQSIYMAEELGFASGTINSMILYNSFEYIIYKQTKIYLASTYQNNLDAGFIPASEMTLVYDGIVEYPAGENNIVIHFQTPYVHTGGNLVIMCHRPWDGTSYTIANLKFKGQFLGGYRTRTDASYRDDIDLFNPPEGQLTWGTAQISFLYTPDHYDNELAALRIIGDNRATVGSVSNYTVRIKNYGSEDQTNYTVKLMGPANTVLASVAGPPIESMQSLEVEIPWTPADLGEICVYGLVEMDGDELADNNQTAGIKVMVHPVGTANVLAAVNDGNDAVEVSWVGSREFAGYQAYRLQAGQEQNEAAWTELTPEADAAYEVTDTSWLTLPDGDYRWAVKAAYTDGTYSLPCFSDVLTNRVQTGKIVGVVQNKHNLAIAGATVSNGRLTATTNSLGEYTLMVPVGSRTLSVSAGGYEDTTVENVVVGAGLFTQLNIVLWQEGDDPVAPMATALYGNYPNPFNPETTISYRIKEPGRVRLQVYNIRGQLVRTLVDEDHIEGHYKRVFDGKDNSGRGLASGVYLIRMSTPGYQQASKMMLMK